MSNEFTTISVYPETRDLLREYQQEHDCDTYDAAIRDLLDEPPLDDTTREHVVDH